MLNIYISCSFPFLCMAAAMWLLRDGLASCVEAAGCVVSSYPSSLGFIGVHFVDMLPVQGHGHLSRAEAPHSCQGHASDHTRPATQRITFFVDFCINDLEKYITISMYLMDIIKSYQKPLNLQIVIL